MQLLEGVVVLFHVSRHVDREDHEGVERSGALEGPSFLEEVEDAVQIPQELVSRDDDRAEELKAFPSGLMDHRLAAQTQNCCHQERSLQALKTEDD